MQHRLIPWVCGVLTIGLLLSFMHRDYPQVGLDFGQFVPRLVDTDLHTRINGPVPQWYTPSFGSGLPAFANPQHTQYSLIQLLLLVTGPWSAVLWSTAIISAIGFAAGYLFFRQTLSLSVVSSTLGAMSVVANGFYIQHIAGGHVGFQQFPLIGLFLFVLTSPRLTILQASALCGLAGASILYGGGALITVLIAGSLFITLPVTHLLVPSVVAPRRLVIIAAASSAIALAICAPKVYAVQAFMARFPREVSDTSDLALLPALFGLGCQLAGGMLIIPVLFVGGYPTQRLEDALVRVTGSGVHVPELDVSVQPVVLAGLAIATVRSAWLIAQGRATLAGAVRSRIALLLVLVTVWIAVETTLVRGVVYPALHQLPILRSMHINHRVASVFILPLTVAGVVAINGWRVHLRPAVGASLLAAALVFQAAYALLPELFYRRWFEITKIEEVHQRVRAGERFRPIARVEDVLEDRVFADHASSRVPYEPLFGYDNERFEAETTEGPIETIRDGRFNLTNPASLIFPELNGLRPFERIRENDVENLRRFINRQQPRWRHPAVLNWLGAVAVGAVAFCLAVLGRAAFIHDRTPHSRAPIA